MSQLDGRGSQGQDLSATRTLWSKPGPYGPNGQSFQKRQVLRDTIDEPPFVMHFDSAENHRDDALRVTAVDRVSASAPPPLISTAP